MLFSFLPFLNQTTAKGFEGPPMVDFLLEYLSIKYKGIEFDRFIYIAAKRQKLYLIENESILAEYPVSTAKNGMGNKSGSYKTPPGLHQIAEKVGEGLPPYTILKQKTSTGRQYVPSNEDKTTGEDIITSRIIHLKGMEPSVNSGDGIDSYERGIFIHGTHEEGLIGSPASKGCVRLKNDDVMDLFEKVEVGTFVIILNN